MNAFLAFCKRWQEPLFWLPALLVIVLLAYYQIPAIDPRAGVDGFGAFWGQLVVAVGVMRAGFFSWLLRSMYFYELGDNEERELIDHACGIDRGSDGKRIGCGPATWQAVVIWVADRVIWLGLFWLLLSRFVP